MTQLAIWRASVVLMQQSPLGPFHSMRPLSAANPEAYRIEERTVTADDTLEIVMAARGGQAVTFLPQHE